MAIALNRQHAPGRNMGVVRDGHLAGGGIHGRISLLSAGRDDARHTLLFLHGWGASREIWWNSMVGMADMARCYSLDLPGTGDTPLAHRCQTMTDMAAWVNETCDRLGAGRVTLVGHSLGGNLCVQTALYFPERVNGVVLVDAALDTTCLPRRVYWTQSPLYGIPAIVASKAIAAPLAHAGRNVPHDHQGGYWGPLARRAGLFLAANKSDRALQAQLRMLCANTIPKERLRDIDAPLMIVHGHHDEVIRVSTARDYAAAVPDCTLAVYPNSHHCPMDQEPERFIAELREFVLTRLKD